MDRKSLKNALRNREKLFGAWVSYAEPSITETFAKAGFDFLAIDMEHSTITLPQAQRIMAASQSYGVPCLPRPVSHSNDYFKPILESGADGLLVQMVNNPEEVENIINYLKYPPIGKRSYGVNRAQEYGFQFNEYISKWNNESCLIIQVESIEAVKNIEDLLSYDEIDGVMIGPLDISGSLGVPGETNHPKVIEASKKVISACKKHGKSCGTQIADPNRKSVEVLFDLGYTYAILGSDLFVLWKWAEEMKNIISNKN
ncbi:MAG: 4-hydroxy-2-oxovalerate aldolase [Flavobacteriaceae bacterium TMED179]|nr:MAG: 4-hydroxy-2-oxovalerate aldolase [Flavobacteriaceae bacterium TMED179]|tara:strand:+ start:3642 stop:4412 length:771 start_codon:yes stop_codon:yes gene_type:complete